jgi:DNA-binding transcriptional LysR family regulator
MLIHDAKIKLCGQEKISGEIKILAETNRRIVTQAIEQFQKNYSDVVFFINHSSEDTTDKYDLIISDKILDKKNFTKHLLVVDKLLLAMKKDNPLVNNSQILVKDLENEKFITMSNTSGLYKLTNEICHAEGFTPNIVIQSDDPDYIRKYIEMGLGISFVPSLSWKGTFSENVECRQLFNIKRYTFAYLNTQKYISKATLTFLDTLLNVAGEYSQEE